MKQINDVTTTMAWLRVKILIKQFTQARSIIVSVLADNTVDIKI